MERTSDLLRGQRQRVGIPFRQPIVEADLIFLKKAHTTQQGSAAAGEFYYLALRKLLKGVHGGPTEACRKDYMSRAPFYAVVLADVTEPGSFDALVCVPTSCVEVQMPYMEAFIRKNPSAADLSSAIARADGTDSTSGLTWSQRRKRMRFDGENSTSAERILVIDDVIHTGDNASLVMDLVRSQLAPCRPEFSLACPLWMV